VIKAIRSDKLINQGFESNMAALNTAMSFSDILSKIYQVRYTPNAIEIRILNREKKLDLVIFLL
jgi:hypothetical protein